MTPGVARVMRALDDERRAVARAFGHDLPSLVAEMQAIGTVEPSVRDLDDLAAAIASGEANRRIKAPDSLAHRYYREDFGHGLLPFTALAAIAGRRSAGRRVACCASARRSSASISRRKAAPPSGWALRDWIGTAYWKLRRSEASWSVKRQLKRSTGRSSRSACSAATSASRRSRAARPQPARKCARTAFPGPCMAFRACST